jgi:hypothetical protein
MNITVTTVQFPTPSISQITTPLEPFRNLLIKKGFEINRNP